MNCSNQYPECRIQGIISPLAIKRIIHSNELEAFYLSPSKYNGSGNDKLFIALL